MFERLSEAFSGTLRKLAGKASISEDNVAEAVRDVRAALLDADVHHEAADAFCEGVLKDALGRRVTKSLKPGEEFIGVVHERLVEFLGGTPGAEEGEGGVLAPAVGVPRFAPGPTIVMMCGLQGSGKTTTCGKVAAYLKKRGRSVLLVAADLQRPAAVEQLHTVAEAVERDMPGGARVDFYAEPEKVAAYGKAVGAAVQVCRRAVEVARAKGIDTVILDTAGRLHIDEPLMDELRQVSRAVTPQQVYLVVDAMTGHDAVNSARAFHESLGFDGVILTKFDSDARGGAALSVKHVAGVPIRFVGVGEKLDALEEFHPERVAGRILGMGDVVSLVERAREQVSDADAEKLTSKLAKGEMSMEDFLSQLRMLRRMGPLKQILGLLPGVGSALKDVHVDEKVFDQTEAMVSSMTRGERRTPSLINNSRRKRIAAGSGTTQDEVSQLVKKVEMMNRLAREMSSMSAGEKMRAMKSLGAGGLESAGLGGLPDFRGKGSTHTRSIKSRFKKRKR